MTNVITTTVLRVLAAKINPLKSTASDKPNVSEYINFKMVFPTWSSRGSDP